MAVAGLVVLTVPNREVTGAVVAVDSAEEAVQEAAEETSAEAPGAAMEAADALEVPARGPLE